MTACRRETWGEFSAIVFAAVRPSEQLPRSWWRLPSAASSQASPSSDVFTVFFCSRTSQRRQRRTRLGRFGNRGRLDKGPLNRFGFLLSRRQSTLSSVANDGSGNVADAT